MTNLAIFASGGGSNAKKIIEYFEKREDVSVALIVSNKKNAGVLNHAKAFDIPSLVLEREDFYQNKSVLKTLEKARIDLIVLAGFLWLIPPYLIETYPERILNIHPALLPKYGGKGMYGMNVHKAVKKAGETVSGPTIHLVNEKYDDGKHLLQVKVPIDKNDTPQEIAAKVLKAEHYYYPRVIDDYVQKIGTKAGTS